MLARAAQASLLVCLVLLGHVAAVQAQLVKRSDGSHSYFAGQREYYPKDGKLMLVHPSNRHVQVISFIHSQTGESRKAVGFAKQLEMGLVTRDWTDIIQNSFAAYILKGAAAVVAGGVFVGALDFAYAAIRNSQLLNDAWNAFQGAYATFTAGSTVVASTGTHALQSAADAASMAKRGGATSLARKEAAKLRLSKRNCEDQQGAETYIPDMNGQCTYWMNPTKDPTSSDFPNDSVLNQFSVDFGNHMKDDGIDRASAGLSPASYTGNDPGHNEVLSAGVTCPGSQVEKDEC